MFFLAVGAVINDFRGSVSRNRVMEFVLNGGVKIFCDGRILFIVDTALRKKYPLSVAEFAVPLARIERTRLQEFAEIIFTEKRLSLFQTVVVQNKALAHIFFQNLGRPDSEIGCALRIYAITRRR